MRVWHGLIDDFTRLTGQGSAGRGRAGPSARDRSQRADRTSSHLRRSTASSAGVEAGSWRPSSGLGTRCTPAGPWQAVAGLGCDRLRLINVLSSVGACPARGEVRAACCHAATVGARRAPHRRHSMSVHYNLDHWGIITAAFHGEKMMKWVWHHLGLAFTIACNCMHNCIDCLQL